MPQPDEAQLRAVVDGHVATIRELDAENTRLRALLREATTALEWAFDSLPFACSGGDPEHHNYSHALRTLGDLREERQNAD